MNHAKIRAKVLSVEAGYPVHVHGCFGECAFVEKGGLRYYCNVCERLVHSADVATPEVQTIAYIRDVNALLKAFDDAEDRIAELEDQ